MGKYKSKIGNKLQFKTLEIIRAENKRKAK